MFRVPRFWSPRQGRVFISVGRHCHSDDPSNVDGTQNRFLIIESAAQLPGFSNVSARFQLKKSTISLLSASLGMNRTPGNDCC